MNIFLILSLCIICLGIGWLIGVKNINKLEGLVDNLEQATDYIEKMETPDIDMMNMTLNQNRDAKATLDISTLHDLETGNVDAAKERLINGLTNNYLDIKEDEAHEIRSLESKNVITRIEELAREHESFKNIITQSKL